MYQQLKHPITLEIMTNVIKRVTDNACIPCDVLNTDYQEYLSWLAEGHTILPPEE